MILIIPALDIKGGRCVQMVQGVEGFIYSDDPIDMAKLWRKENAKTLHVTDIDGATEGRLVNFEMIERMAKTVDIPIELSGGFRTFDEVEKALGIGIYRVVLETMLLESPDEAKRALDTFGPSRVVAGISAENGFVRLRGWHKPTGMTAVSVGLNAGALGFKRILYTDITADGTLRGPNLPAMRQLAETTKSRITASGGVSGLDDLLKLQELEPIGVDSVIIGRALYENRFSCQDIWRLSEAGDYPYTAKV
jgi:phosphoribosylformimino-5-aminoimidazole carboxamide ribotide isomerase